MKYKYYKCSVETADEYRSAGFVVKINGKDPIEKIKKFFEKNKNWIRYDGVYLPLTQCCILDGDLLNYVFRETIFGFVRTF